MEQTNVERMTKEISKHKNKNPGTQKIYKQQADEHKGELLSKDIICKCASLQNTEKIKVDLNNIEEVQQRTLEYFEACSKAQAFPSIMGLASIGYGISRQALNQWLLKHPDSETTEFVNRAKDIIADILTNASLNNNANSVQAIFQLKNNHGFADKVEVTAVADTNGLTEQNYDDIEKRYANLPCE